MIDIANDEMQVQKDIETVDSYQREVDKLIKVAYEAGALSMRARILQALLSHKMYEAMEVLDDVHPEAPPQGANNG